MQQRAPDRNRQADQPRRLFNSYEAPIVHGQPGVTLQLTGRDRGGAISRRLFAVGPATKGAFWEMTAVPDIRRQTEKLAEHLAMLVKAVPPKAKSMIRVGGTPKR